MEVMNPAPIIILAPIRGLTHQAFRNAFAKHIGGLDLAVSPYLEVTPQKVITEGFLRENDPKKNLIPTIHQLLGKDASAILDSINQIASLGHQEVNLNLGCPYPMVANKGMGSGLLPTPDKLISLINEILERTPLRLSLKLRLGRYEDHEIDKLIDLLQDPRLGMTTLHPRIGTQLYSGRTSPERFLQVQKELNRPLCYNGDIVFKRDYQLLNKQLNGVTHWMIGRGLLMNLFLPQEIKGKKVTLPEKRIALKDFIVELENYYLSLPQGRSHFMHRQLDLWQYFCHHFSPAEKAYKKIKKSKNIENYLEAREEVFFWPLSTDGEVDSFSNSRFIC